VTWKESFADSCLHASFVAVNNTTPRFSDPPISTHLANQRASHRLASAILVNLPSASSTTYPKPIYSHHLQKVAAAWSRSNFPPPALDTMFRAIEAVYRIAKQFMGKLNEIGPKPSSPKALGDLLMRWVSGVAPMFNRET